ncbi:MAG: Chromosome partition protein Smc [Syntrophomonadaceae bacterium]|nr:Chromosome partition protein Smc [Bacillota bacterium]
MKMLTKMLLIKWHYFERELLEFKTVNFLTGKNAAGKSTIIDALQLVMLGDTTGYFFNKAASDRSNRSLKGYLRGEVAEDEEARTIYLRENDFTSYIVLEFNDTAEKRSFCLGVVFDSYRDGNHRHQFFYLKSGLPENCFYLDGVPMNIKALKAWLLNHHPRQYQLFESNRDYRDVMAGVLGHLNERFFRLFRKAVPFSPIINIKQFITEFVCDMENEVDITHMQENIRQYKQLEEELALVEKKVAVLESIAGLYRAYREETERLRMQQYLLDRSVLEKRVRDMETLCEETAVLQASISDLRGKIDQENKLLDSLEEQRRLLLEERAQSDIYKKQQDLQKEKDSLLRELEEIQNSEERLGGLLTAHLACWREVAAWVSGNLDKQPADGELARGLQALEEGLRHYRSLEHTRLQETKTVLEIYAAGLSRSFYDLEQEKKRLEQRIKVLEEELAGLRRGIKPYPEKLLELRETITRELRDLHGRETQVKIFADLLEIRDPRWQNAVEAYLHTQKFYLLVEPEYFLAALRVYDREKNNRKFYDLGLVDLEKVVASVPVVLPGSLAEEVETDDPLARAYTDYLLGRVMKCETLEELRLHRTAVTPGCMLYHNFVARQLNPARFAEPYIGRQAVARQIVSKESELADGGIQLQALLPRLDGLGQAVRTPLLTENDIRTMLDLKVRVVRKTGTEQKLAEVAQELVSLDLSYLTGLDKRLKQCEAALAKSKAILEKDKGSLIAAEIHLKNKEAALPALEREKESLAAELAARYAETWRIESGEPRFSQELKNRRTPDNIINSFTPVVKGTETRKKDRWDELLELRIGYNRDFKGAFAAAREDNDDYDAELLRLKESTLLDYRQKIKEAKERAQVQFKEDFISKLRANIDRVQEQISDLNRAIKDNFFGRDRYRFTVTPQPQYRRFYEMITDDMLVEGYNLFSAVFQEQHGDTVEELFRQIVDTGEGLLSADRRQQLAENLQRFTDYRTFLEFDMVNIDEEGRESRLSRVITKKSGGETQTPFYVAVLASFLQVYRVRQDEANTMRLIVFDEAYNKMDHQRIQESIKMIREMGLQVILSAPTEKIADIAPLVDRNLLVHRLKKATLVKAFDPKELTEMGA